MEKTNLDTLAEEYPEITRRRVIMLESLLERAIDIITEYAHDTWVTKAHEIFTAHDPDVPMDYAEETWKEEISNTTKDFGYPVPPSRADVAAREEMSYWWWGS